MTGAVFSRPVNVEPCGGPDNESDAMWYGAFAGFCLSGAILCPLCKKIAGAVTAAEKELISVSSHLLFSRTMQTHFAY